MKIVLDLTPQTGQTQEDKPGSHCCRTNMVICPGYGDENFAFPTVEQAVTRSLARLDEKLAAAKLGARSKSGKAAPQSGLKAINVGFIPGLPSKGLVPSQAAGQKQSPSTLIRVANVDSTLFAVAEGIRLMMDAGKYDAIVAERFDDHADKVAWAKDVVAKRWPNKAAAIASLEGQLNQLRSLYLSTIPRVLAVLVAQNPEVSEGRLLQAALQSLDEELAQILGVLRIWTDAFGQLRSGNYKQLEAVVFSVEQAFRLFEGMSPSAKLDPDVKERLKTSKFHVGNVFVARFSEHGPATLPGTRGPVGAHAIEVPHDERSIITLMLVLYMHEFRHDIFADVEGLGDELTMVVAKAIAEACEKQEVVFSLPEVQIDRTTVPMSSLMVKIFADTIGEVDADISGGILLSGPAYLYNMISTFSAFNSKPEGVFRNPRLLRTGSYFSVRKLESGQKTLQFWPHPPDYIRAYIVAAALDEIGFPEEAIRCRLLADQAVGTVPEFITWHSDNAKSKTAIRIPTADLKLVAPVVAKALIRTKLATLGGLSTSEIINWTPRRQMKVDRLVENIMNGSSELPEDIGDVYATYVAAAASLAYWRLVQAGVPAVKAAPHVELHCLAMLDAVKARYDDNEQGLDGGAVELTDGSEAHVADLPDPAPVVCGDGNAATADGLPATCDPTAKDGGCRGGTVS
ncbi:MAG: hypothetical protein SGJ27_05535 [Candidatus Melainabacteria bacterium]|nr:hypothetical protein [Candidatus Melainabacteria bacterium]